MEAHKGLLLLFFFITLGLELSDTKVYEPQIRALLGTASKGLVWVQAATRERSRGLNPTSSAQTPNAGTIHLLEYH